MYLNALKGHIFVVRHNEEYSCYPEFPNKSSTNDTVHLRKVPPLPCTLPCCGTDLLTYIGTAWWGSKAAQRTMHRSPV